MTNELDALFWRACDILRRDDNTQSLLDYVEQISWLLFLKSFEDLEDKRTADADYRDERYSRIVDGYYCWSVWTRGRVNQALETLRGAQAEQRAAEKTLAGLVNGKPPQPALPLDHQDTKEPETLAAARTRLDAALLAVTAAESQVEAEKRAQAAALAPLAARDGELAAALQEGASGKQLLKFLDEHLFPHLRGLEGGEAQAIVRQLFEETPSKLVRNGIILREAIDIIDRIDFHQATTVHTLAHLYESLLAKMGREGGMSGEFYTPRPIIEFMVAFVDPKIGETIYDPAAGSFGFPVEAYKHMEQQVVTTGDRQLLQGATFFGREKKPLPYLLGVMNAVLHGIETPHLVRGNTLALDVRAIGEKQRKHVILTNPPFGGTENVDAIKSNFRFVSSATSILFMQHIMAMLRQDGRAATVIDEGVLFKTNERAYVDTKKDLLENYNLYAIVSLPAGVFANAVANGTGPKTNLLFFDHHGPTRAIWYYDAHAVGFSLTRTQKPIAENDLPDCLAMWRQYDAWRRTPDHERPAEPPLNARCWVTPVAAIVARNYDLSARNPNRTNDFTHRPPEELAADIADKQARIAELVAEIQELLEGESE
jgi:type I restriction enzyme M protein